MKYVAVLLCMSGLAAVCLGQLNTTVANLTTAAETTTSGVASGTNSATTPSVTTNANPGTAAPPGGGVTTDAATGATTAGATTVSCLSCTGDETDVCGTATASTAGIPRVDCDECWVYRDENTTSGNVTIIRGCSLGSDTCTSETESEYCDTAGGITSCRRCCTTNDCNHNGLEVSGNGAADVHVSIAVTMASALFAIVALRQ